MAHIREVARKTGRAYEVLWRTDTRRKAQRTFTQRREAERFAVKVESDLAAGNGTAALARSSKTFREVAVASLAVAEGRLKRATYEGYVRMYARHVFPHLGARRITTITSQDMEAWIATLAATPSARTGAPLHPSTVKHAFIAANKVFRYAVRHQSISANPATGTPLPRVQHADAFEPQFLSAAEVDALADAHTDAAPDDLLVRVAGYAGLRAGELQALRVGDVDVHRRRIRVRRTLVRTQEGWREDSPKSANSTRTVPIPTAPAEQLRAYLADVHPAGDDPSARLWPGRNYAGGGTWRGGLDWTKRLDYESFYRRRFRAAAASIGRPELRFHDLRHTAASLWAASGMPMERVAAALGHADTGVTYKTYLHFFPDQWDADMARFEASLGTPDATITPLRRDA